LKFNSRIILVSLLSVVIMLSCVTKRKRSETSKFGKFYHNTTSYYNGYWNATEILRESMIRMREANTDNYNQLLEVEDFVSLPDQKMVDGDMNKAIEKVTIVSNLHEPGDWVDDCYVLMAKAQYFKQDYETAEATLQYFQEDFNPKNPYGRNYERSPKNKKALKKARDEERKEQARLKKEEKEQKEKEKKEAQKSKEQERKEKAKEREAARKQREKEREKAKKDRAKGIKTPVPPANPPANSTSSTDIKTEEKAKIIEETPEAIPPKPKKKKDKTAYNEGLLWLSKTYIKRQHFYGAELILNKLSETENLQKQVEKELPAAFAMLYIKQGKYTDAANALKEAIDITKDRELRARYSFILAQIYERAQDLNSAATYYAKANKYSNKFQMEFMSKMSLAKSELQTNKKTKDEILAVLNKMIADIKFADYKHQVYYTMGEIELSQGNLDESIAHFQSSIANNNNDTRLKTDAYYTISSELFKKERYKESKLYYDSTLLVMAKTDKRIDEVIKLSKNLTDIAKNIDIINYQDTLLYFASLDQENQRKAMMEYLDRKKNTSKATAGPMTEEKPRPEGLKKINPATGGTIDFGKSNFFAYNPQTREKAREEFVKVWGNSIKLQDNWRISSRMKDALADDVSAAEAVAEFQKADKVVVESADFKNLMKEVPQNPVQKREAQERITAAMFELGKLYRNVLENYRKSAETLEAMHTRFGPTSYELESFYHLYLDFADLQNNDKAEEYKSRLIRKYPESIYAKILTDPSYANNLNSEANKIDDYYDATMKYFSSGNYSITRERIKKLRETFGEENKYGAKLALMEAMVNGHFNGKDAYIKSLNDVVIAFPNSQEQTKAKEILRFLTGDAEAFSQVNEDEASTLYIYDETRTHFVAVVTYGLSEMENIDIKVSISEFNKKYFKNEKLQLSDATLNKTDNSQIILIKKFPDAAKTMEYYQKVMDLKSEFIMRENAGYDILPISQANYLKMLGQYSANAYRFFFNKFYLSKK